VTDVTNLIAQTVTIRNIRYFIRDFLGFSFPKKTLSVVETWFSKAIAAGIIIMIAISIKSPEIFKLISEANPKGVIIIVLKTVIIPTILILHQWQVIFIIRLMDKLFFFYKLIQILTYIHQAFGIVTKS